VPHCTQLTRECGLTDIVPKLWVAPVNGVLPGNGFRLNWLGLWSDVADGVSIENIKVRCVLSRTCVYLILLLLVCSAVCMCVCTSVCTCMKCPNAG